jgi:hypothetical protein
MGAVDDVVNEISRDIQSLEEGEFGEVFIDGRLLDGPAPEEYLMPETDVLFQKPYHDDHLIDLAREKRLLGVYVRMRSPGSILLFKDNLRDFFWGLIGLILPRAAMMTRFDLAASARLVALKTYYHELFHFDCDVMGMLFDNSFDHLIEEALAVARARARISADRSIWQSQIGRMNGVVYHLIMDEAFKYTSPGYRDWPRYADEARFKVGLLNYLNPCKCRDLQSNGVVVEDILFAMLGNLKGGFLERAV